MNGPLSLVAELTHRCPLACAYCSNPLELIAKGAELDTAAWTRVAREAAALGVLHLHLTGGEPLARADLVEIVAAAHGAGLYTNLITSGIGLSDGRLADLAAAGLDHVQLSIQGVVTSAADAMAGRAGAQAEKARVARRIAASGLGFTVNAVIARHNIGDVAAIIDQAVAWGAQRVEIAHVQYHGWAALNRAALLPERDAVLAAIAAVDDARARHAGRIIIDSVLPDLHARRPKRCFGGWGQSSLLVAPDGAALPCHAARTLPGLAFWSVRDRPLAEIWSENPAFQRFRGTDWMAEPCRSCDRRDIDGGGCRCQAFALTGDAAATDPVCELSPHHAALKTAVALDAKADAAPVPRPHAHTA